MSTGSERQENALLDGCAQGLRADARQLGRRMRALSRLAALSEVDAAVCGQRRFVELEVAGSLAVGQVTAQRWLAEAHRYTSALPATLALLEAGELLVHQAVAVFYATQHCPAEVAAAVEAEVLPAGAGLCPSDLRRLVTRVVLRIESEQADSAAAAEQRHAEAAAERRTFSQPQADGMGLAGAVLTAEQLRTWSLGLDTLECAERISDREAGVQRTADQRRADLFAALPAMVLASRPPGSQDVAAQVVLNVHVPVATVLDLSSAPGGLDGYGPLSAEHVRLLRPTAFRRVMVDARTGRPIAVDDKLTPAEADPQAAREQVQQMLRPEVVTDTAEPGHDPSVRLARLVDVRDVRCAGPGCGSTRNHRDHLIAWPAGPTAAWNLGPLSARCHQAKHAGWTLVRHPDGSVSWTSPLGRSYQRPSPHDPPPHVDLYAEPPAPRPAPVAAAPRWLTEDDLAAPAPAPPEREAHAARPELPDDPPF